MSDGTSPGVGDVHEQPTHYCRDCEEELVLLYDKRPDDSIPVVCGHCGGNNTVELTEVEA